MTLNPAFRELINNFKEKFEVVQEYCKDFLEDVKELGLTWKIHIICIHLPQWLERHTVGMSLYSEQCAESTHHDFSKTYKRFKRDISHPDHGKQLLRSVVEHASRRM